jgi:RNA polymerase sigma-70 factor (ECF subfamily)
MADQHRQFEELFLPHLDAAYNLARWIVRHDSDAQDIVQDAYLRAFKGFHSFRGVNGKAWLLTIVRNAAYTWLSRRVDREKLVPFEDARHADIIAMPDSIGDSVHDQRRQDLQNALQRLPAEFREVIVLYELDGLSYKELASTLSIPMGTVMSRLNRARKRLQDELLIVRKRGAQNEL